MKEPSADVAPNNAATGNESQVVSSRHDGETRRRPTPTSPPGAPAPSHAPLDHHTPTQCGAGIGLSPP